MGKLHVIFARILCLLLVGGDARTTKAYSPSLSDEELKNATVIEYVDSNGFDSIIVFYLTQGVPLLIVQTDFDKPVWEKRLNRWLDAWVEAEQQRKNSRPYGFNSAVSARYHGYILTCQSDRSHDSDVNTYRVKIIVRVVVGPTGDMLKATEKATKFVLDEINWWLDKPKRVKMLKPYELIVRRDEKGLYQFIFRKRH